MNKKGYYMVIMVLLTLSAVILLHAQVNKRMTGLNRYLGDSQEPLLRLNSDVRYYDAYLNLAAQKALKETMIQVAAWPALQGLPQSTSIAATYCTQINSNDYPSELRPIILTDTIKKQFNTNLNSYLTDYVKKTEWEIPLDNFETYASGNTFTATAIKPTTLPIATFFGIKLGTATYQPRITLTYDHEFDRYDEIRTILTTIAVKCSYTSDPLKCSQQLAPTWTVQDVRNRLYQFTIPIAGTNTCYYLRLPEPNQNAT